MTNHHQPELPALMKDLGFALIRVLQDDFEPIKALARAVKIDFPDGEPVVSHAASRPADGQVQPLPMSDAPRDGTMVRLLVEFTDHATEDCVGPAWTIGAYASDDETGGWQFAGWCWTHDHFTEGEGTPVGWLPMLASAPTSAQAGDYSACCDTPAYCSSVRRCTAKDSRTPDAAARARELGVGVDVTGDGTHVSVRDGATIVYSKFHPLTTPSDAGGEAVAVTLDWLRSEAKRKGWNVREGTSVPTPDGDWIHPFEVTLPCRDLLAAYATTPPNPGDARLRELAERWEVAAKVCDADAERMQGQPTANELLRDAAQYRQSAQQVLSLLDGKGVSHG